MAQSKCNDPAPNRVQCVYLFQPPVGFFFGLSSTVLFPHTDWPRRCWSVLVCLGDRQTAAYAYAYAGKNHEYFRYINPAQTSHTRAHSHAFGQTIELTKCTHTHIIESVMFAARVRPIYGVRPAALGTPPSFVGALARIYSFVKRNHYRKLCMCTRVERTGLKLQPGRRFWWWWWCWIGGRSASDKIHTIFIYSI